MQRATRLCRLIRYYGFTDSRLFRLGGNVFDTRYALHRLFEGNGCFQEAFSRQRVDSSRPWIHKAPALQNMVVQKSSHRKLECKNGSIIQCIGFNRLEICPVSSRFSSTHLEDLSECMSFECGIASNGYLLSFFVFIYAYIFLKRI
ncbi:unnamed protein product [Ectocarpus sp. 4 AP-2014]